MRFFAEIQRVDDEKRMVYGYAATEQRATDGMIVTRDAIAGALDDYMEFANVREMHQASAVGVTREANVDDTGLYIGAEVVDDAAWNKVKRGVYKGFSIGAKVTSRDPDDKTVVRGIALREISLVDRPADPGAKIDLWHADGFEPGEAEIDEDDDDEIAHRDFSEKQRKDMAAKGEAMPDGSFPIANRQDLENAVRAYGRAKNKRAVRRHIMKRARALGAMDLIPEEWKTMNRAEGEGAVVEHGDAAEQVATAETGAEAAEGGGAAEDSVEHADTAEAPEGEADPVQRAVQAAEAAAERATEAVDAIERAVAPDEAPRELPGAELRRGMGTVCRLNYLLSELAYLAMDAQWESEIEGDNSSVPGKLRSALIELAKAYKAMSDEELAELMNGVGVDVQLENGVILLMAAGADLERAEGVTVSEAQAERLDQVFGVFVERGWTPKATPEAGDDVQRQVEALTADKETLLRTVGTLTGRLDAMAEDIERLRDQVLPAKTAAAHATPRPVEKADDAAGTQTERVDAALTDEDVQRALAALPSDERADLLMRAALRRPRVIAR